MPDCGMAKMLATRPEEKPRRYSKASLYGCLACDCPGCLDAECSPGAERATAEKACELGWVQ